MSNSTPIVAVAGATGHLGKLIALNLRKKNIPVRALLRPGTEASRTRDLRDAGVEIREVDLLDVTALTGILNGATTLVSALQGLRPVIIDVQSALLEASVAAKVQRFIPSDFSLDFTKCEPGSNRNLDLRREFHERLEKSGIQWTSVLNGAFMDLVTGGMLPLVLDSWGKVVHFGDVNQKLDVTTVPDVAAYTAEVAADPNPTPKFLRIAGDTFNANDLTVILQKVRGKPYTTQWFGSAGFLKGFSGFLRYVLGGEDKVFPPWQGMQYIENMVSGKGKLEPLDNDRYPDLKWTTAEMALREADAEKAKQKSS